MSAFEEMVARVACSVAGQFCGRQDGPTCQECYWHKRDCSMFGAYCDRTRAALKAACEGMPVVELVHHGKWGIVPASAPDKEPAPGFHALLPLEDER